MLYIKLHQLNVTGVFIYKLHQLNTISIFRKEILRKQGKYNIDFYDLAAIILS